MHRYCVIGVMLLAPTIGCAKGLPSETITRCEQLVVLQADAARNPTREFTLDLQGASGARFVYLGVRHTFDPTHQQFADMHKAWERLQPTEAFYEGRSTAVQSSLTAAIKASGEPGLIRYLAATARIPAHSLEPTREVEAKELLGTFTAEQLLLFFVTRNVVAERDRRSISGGALDTVLDRYLAREHGVAQFASVLPDAAAFLTAYSRWFPGMDPRAAPAGWFDPLRTSAETGSVFFNDVNRASSAFRDVHMYRLLARAWKPGARLFAAVGRDHIPAQAAALRCALK
jgi:hypothetical protein